MNRGGIFVALMSFFLSMPASAAWTSWYQVTKYRVSSEYLAIEFAQAIPEAQTQGCTIPSVLVILTSSGTYKAVLANIMTAALTGKKVAFYIDSCYGAPSNSYGQFSSLYVDTQL